LDADQALLWGQVGYLLDTVAGQGLDTAGETTAISSHDCSDCPDGPWKIVYNFRTGVHGWTVPWIAGGVYSAGNGIVGTNYSGSAWGASMSITGLDIDSIYNPTEIRGHASKASGNTQLWLEQDDSVIWNAINAANWTGTEFNLILPVHSIDKIEMYMNASANRLFQWHDVEIWGDGPFPPGAIARI